MAKEDAIGFKFKGEATGFVRAVGQINKNVGSLQKNIKSISSGFRTLSAITGIAFSIRGISRYIGAAVTLAKAQGMLTDTAKDTLTHMTGISRTLKEIKTHIGEAILNSKMWNFWAGKLENTLIKVNRLANKGDAQVYKGFSKESIQKMLSGIDEFTDKLIEKKKKAEEALEDFKKLKEKNYDWAFAQFSGMDISRAFPAKEVVGAGMARGGNTLASAPVIKDTEEISQALERQQEIVAGLTDAFQSMFSNVGEGFDGMVDSMIDSLQRWITQLLSKAAVLMLIRTIFPGTAMGADATTGLMGMFGSGMFSGGGIKPSVGSLSGIGSASSSPLKVIGKISGRDIYLSASRYGNMLQGGT